MARFTDEDSYHKFGQAGDIPVVGDFDGDGIDEIAVVRGSRLIVDSNGNGEMDAADKVFEIEVKEKKSSQVISMATALTRLHST